MLKGKALKDFEEWYVTDFNHKNIKLYKPNKEHLIDAFWKMKHQFQQGVLREYFETKGIHFEHQRSEISEGDVKYAFMILDGDTNLLAPVITATDYNTAFTHAIDKACELYGRGE